jgi:hypothetical protein
MVLGQHPSVGDRTGGILIERPSRRSRRSGSFRFCGFLPAAVGGSGFFCGAAEQEDRAIGFSVNGVDRPHHESDDIEKSEGDTGARARSGFLSGRSRRDVVELCGIMKFILVQAHDLLRLQRDGHVASAEADVGVMPLGFRQIDHLSNEAERLGEVPELECSLNPAAPRPEHSTPASDGDERLPPLALAADRLRDRGCRFRRER